MAHWYWLLPVACEHSELCIVMVYQRIMHTKTESAYHAMQMTYCECVLALYLLEYVVHLFCMHFWIKSSIFCMQRFCMQTIYDCALLQHYLPACICTLVRSWKLFYTGKFCFCITQQHVLGSTAFLLWLLVAGYLVAAPPFLVPLFSECLILCAWRWDDFWRQMLDGIDNHAGERLCA